MRDKKSVLVTGCCGFIGSNLFDALLQRGWHVDGVDDLSNGSYSFVARAASNHSVTQDVSICQFNDPSVLARIRKQQYDIVFHIAALPRVSYSVKHPMRTNDVNVSKTLELIDVCKDNIDRFVFASSSSVYGGADVLPTPETCPKNPKSPYALQKSIIEDYLKLYNALYGFESVCLRFFNVFGPNQLGNSTYATAVASWLTQASNGQQLRSDGDGTQTRDMCYIDNAVDACIKAASANDALNAACINIACGDMTFNLDILRYFLTRYKVTAYNAPWRPGDVMHTCADISAAKKLIGYTPIVRVWSGLERTANWFDANWSWIKNIELGM